MDHQKNKLDQLSDPLINIESIVNTIREALLVLNGDLQVIFANQSFYRLFKVTPEETLGKFVYDLGNKEWNIPALRKLLEEILPINTIFEDFEVDHTFSHIGKRVMKLNARRIPEPPQKPRFILLAIEDITEHIKFRHLQNLNAYVKNIIQTLPDPFIVLDGNLQIISANASFYSTFRIDPESIENKPFYALGEGEWNIPSLKERLDNILLKKTQIENFEIELYFSKIGVRTFLFNASLMVQNPKMPFHILLSMKDITEEKKSKENLISALQRYEAYIEVSKQLAWTTNGEGLVEEDMPFWRKHTGQSYEEILGEGWLNAVHPDDRLHVLKVWKKALQAKGDYEVEYRIMGLDGKYRDFLGRAKPIMDETDTIKEWVGTSIDITKIKHIEKQLKESLLKFRMIFDQTFQFMGLLKPDGTLLEVNRTGLAFIGAQLKDVLQKPFWETPWWSNMPESQKILREAILKASAGETVYFESFNKAKDGSIHLIESSIRPVKDETGKVIYLIPEGKDSTKRRKAEKELKEAAEKYRAIFDQTFEFMGLLTLDGTLIEANRTALQFAGVEEKEVLQKPFWETPWWTHSKEMQTKIKKSIEKAASGELVRFEATHMGKDGELHYVDFILKPIKDDNGKVIYLVPEGHDITKLRETEKSLERLIDSKTAFTSMISHELRTPLAAIKESISLLLEGILGDISLEQKEYLVIAKQNIDRLIRLVTQILDFQKMEDQRMVFHIEPQDICSVVKEVEKMMGPLCKKKNIEIRLEISEKSMKVPFDRDRITQVLTNLLNNALKATEKGYITIKIHQEGKFVQVSVSDTGIGIAKEFLSKIFLKYQQFSPKPGGTGLGLLISQEIILAHHGKIWAESVVGKGTTIYFVLPLENGRKKTI
ncbi:MAG: PAS domain S-box protein [Chlamydiota bacterium]